MKSIKKILMERDNMSEIEADELIREAQEALECRLAEGEMPDDICMEFFGLEPDYITELI